MEAKMFSPVIEDLARQWGISPQDVLAVHDLTDSDVFAHSADDLIGYRPRKGSPVTCMGDPWGIAVRVEGNICWTNVDGIDAPLFIWRFGSNKSTGQPAHLNRLFHWPEKEANRD